MTRRGADPDSRTAFALVVGLVFADLVGFAIVLPLLPSYGARHTGSDFAIGLLVASYSLVHLLLAPWWGRMSDRFGRRPILLLGLIGSSFSYLLFAWADSFELLLLSRLLAGAAGSTVNVAQATLADLTAPERRSQAMGVLGAAFGMAFIVGPALAGISSRFGSAAPGYVAAAITGGNALLALVLLPETGRHRAIGSQRPAWRRLAPPLAVMFFETLSFTVMYAIFTLYAERMLGYGREGIAYLFAYLGLITAVVQGGVVGRLVRRLGEVRLMVLGSLLLAAGLISIPLTVAESPRWLVPALLTSLLFVAAGTGLVTPSVSGFVSRVTELPQQGRALGMLQSVSSGSRILGPLLFGAVSDATGVLAPFVVAALMSLVAAAFAVRAEKLRP